MASPTLCQLYPHKFVLYCARSDERVPTSVGAEVIVVARQDLPRAAAARLSTEHGPRHCLHERPRHVSPPNMGRGSVQARN